MKLSQIITNAEVTLRSYALDCKMPANEQAIMFVSRGLLDGLEVVRELNAQDVVGALLLLAKLMVVRMEQEIDQRVEVVQ